MSDSLFTDKDLDQDEILKEKMSVKSSPAPAAEKPST